MSFLTEEAIAGALDGHFYGWDNYNIPRDFGPKRLAVAKAEAKAKFDAEAKAALKNDCSGISVCAAILKIVCAVTGYTKGQITGKRRTINLVTCRQAVIYLCLKHAKAGETKIGRVLGGVDQSTVRYHIRSFENDMSRIDEIVVAAEAILRLLALKMNKTGSDEA